MGPKNGTKTPEEVTYSSDPGVNETLKKFEREFSEGLTNHGDEEDLHEFEDGVPLEKRDDHLND